MGKSKSIEFIVGGLDIPRVGLTEVGKVVEVDEVVARSLIDQAIAKWFKSKKEFKEALRRTAETSTAIEIEEGDSIEIKEEE